MEKKHFKIGEAIRWGFKTFLNQIMFFLLAGLAFVGVYLVVSIISTLFMSLLAQRTSEDSPLMIFLLGVLFLVVSLFFVWLVLGMMKIMLDIYDYGKAEFKTLFSQAHLVVPFMGASFLFALAVGIGVAFFVIPGIYLYCRYFFFNYIMVDKNLGVLEAFQESSRLTEGARWQILGLSMVSFFLNILPIFIFVTMLATVYAYRRQQENSLQLLVPVQER